MSLVVYNNEHHLAPLRRSVIVAPFYKCSDLLLLSVVLVVLICITNKTCCHILLITHHNVTFELHFHDNQVQTVNEAVITN